MRGKLSIQITLHNRDKYIRASVLSALHCGYEDAEILIFDDASSDKSAEIVKDLCREYPERIRCIHSDENIGCARARARLVESTECEYILPHDDDDIMLPFDIAGQIDFLDNHPDTAVSYGKIILADENLKPAGQVMGNPFSRIVLPYWNPVASATSIIRRRDLIAAGNYMPAGNTVKTVATDLFLWFRLSQKRDLHFDNSFRLVYRQHGAQLTSNRDLFLSTANYIHNYVIDANRELYGRIMSGSLSVSSDEVRAAVLLLAIISRYMDGASSQRLSVINAAQSLAPDDYGAALLKMDYFFEHGDYSAAIAEAGRALSSCRVDIFARKSILEKLHRILEVMGSPDADIIGKQIEATRKEYSIYDMESLQTTIKRFN